MLQYDFENIENTNDIFLRFGIVLHTYDSRTQYQSQYQKMKYFFLGGGMTHFIFLRNIL